MAWEALKNNYEPDNGYTIIDLKQEFSASTLDSAENDPEEWLVRLEQLQTRLVSMGVTHKQDDLLLYIIRNLPKDYNNRVENCQLELKENNLT